MGIQWTRAPRAATLRVNLARIFSFQFARGKQLSSGCRQRNCYIFVCMLLHIIVKYIMMICACRLIQSVRTYYCRQINYFASSHPLSTASSWEWFDVWTETHKSSRFFKLSISEDNSIDNEHYVMYVNLNKLCSQINITVIYSDMVNNRTLTSLNLIIVCWYAH
jgi:hypothetical protein